jgi:hypothetical protein
MIKSCSYSPGYIVVLKCAVSDGRLYICGMCCYGDCRVETFDDTLKSRSLSPRLWFDISQ